MAVREAKGEADEEEQAATDSADTADGATGEPRGRTGTGRTGRTGRSVSEIRASGDEPGGAHDVPPVSARGLRPPPLPRESQQTPREHDDRTTEDLDEIEMLARELEQELLAEELSEGRDAPAVGDAPDQDEDVDEDADTLRPPPPESLIQDLKSSAMPPSTRGESHPENDQASAIARDKAAATVGTLAPPPLPLEWNAPSASAAAEVTDEARSQTPRQKSQHKTSASEAATPPLAAGAQAGHKPGAGSSGVKPRSVVLLILLAAAASAMVTYLVSRSARDSAGNAPARDAVEASPPANEAASSPAPAERAAVEPREETSAAEPHETSTAPDEVSAEAPQGEPGTSTGVDAPAKPPVARAKAPSRATRRARRSKATGAAEEALSEVPSRPAIIAAINAVRPQLAACAEGHGGIAQLDLSIAGTGRVAHVLVGGDLAGTREGSCIARALRKARFPRFSQDRFRILYPLAL